MAPRTRSFTYHRGEQRIPMELPVFLDGHRRLPGTESTFTENVSARGARVGRRARLEQVQTLTFASRTGEFRSSARVAYCQPLQGDCFAVVLEFLEVKGRW